MQQRKIISNKSKAAGLDVAGRWTDNAKLGMLVEEVIGP
jgi:hypothetical protein